MHTHTLLHLLSIFYAHSNPSRPSQVPPRLPGHVLHHDPRQNDQLRFYWPQNRVIGEIEAVCDLFRHPHEVFVSGHHAFVR